MIFTLEDSENPYEENTPQHDEWQEARDDLLSSLNKRLNNETTDI